MNRPAPGFVAAAAAISLAHLAIAAIYVLRLPLVMDEFQGAEVVHRLGEELPYRDFKPYKTVLGYYLQRPFLGLAETSWGGMMAVKLGMAATTALTLFGSALVLRRHFRSGAVLVGLALVAVMSTLLERGADLRVDTLTALAGWGALLCLLERRYALAGALVAASFCISQKGVYYVLSTHAALVLTWALQPTRRRETGRGMLTFAATSAAGLAVYLASWSAMAGGTNVFRATFFSHGAIALGDLYDIQLRYWGQTLERNPLFYGLALGGLLLLDRTRREADPRWILVPYGVTLIALCAWHKQPWPYFFVLLIPTVHGLGVACLDRIASFEALRRSSARLIAGAVLIAFGILWPLLRLPANLARDNGPQERTMRIAESLLEPGDTYFAGLHFLYRHDQVHRRVAWLDRPRAAALRALSEPEERSLIGEIERDPPKLVIDSYRIQQLPDGWRRYLGRHYSHLAANVFSRSQVLPEAPGSFELAFGGRYLVESPTPSAFEVDGRTVRTGETIELAAGAHEHGGGVVRLKLVPAIPIELTDEERAPSALFPNVYDY